jgi:hypothetical protein
VERRKTSLPVKRHKRQIPETFTLLRILSIILASIVLEINFINVWSLNTIFLLVLVFLYAIFIFYPKMTTKNTVIDIVKFGLGIIFLFVGFSLFVYVAKSTVTHEFPFNVGFLISAYALFWVVIGWVLVVKSRFTNIDSRFIRK